MSWERDRRRNLAVLYGMWKSSAAKSCLRLPVRGGNPVIDAACNSRLACSVTVLYCLTGGLGHGLPALGNISYGRFGHEISRFTTFWTLHACLNSPPPTDSATVCLTTPSHSLRPIGPTCCAPPLRVMPCALCSYGNRSALTPTPHKANASPLRLPPLPSPHIAAQNRLFPRVVPVTRSSGDRVLLRQPLRM